MSTDALIVQRAVADPSGARVAIFEYGRTIGFPAGKLSMLNFRKSGIEEWTNTVIEANPIALGMAWWAIEEGRIPPTWDDPTAGQEPEIERAESQERKEDTVAVIQPSAAVSLIDPGFYGAQITDIIETKGEYGPQLQFTFTLLNDDGKPMAKDDGSPLTRRSWASSKWHEKAKLYAWAKTILKGKCPPPTEPFDWENLMNRKCDVELAPSKKDESMVNIVAIYAYRSMSVNEEEDDFEKVKPVAAGAK